MACFGFSFINFLITQNRFIVFRPLGGINHPPGPLSQSDHRQIITPDAIHFQTLAGMDTTNFVDRIRVNDPG